MIDTLAHELAEIATDPDTLTGWLTTNGTSGARECGPVPQELPDPQKSGQGEEPVLLYSYWGKQG